MTLQQHIQNGRRLIEGSAALRREDAEVEAVLDVLHKAMETLDQANQLVMRRQGRLTKTDRTPLIRLANDLEGYAVDLMSAAKKLS